MRGSRWNHTAGTSTQYRPDVMDERCSKMLSLPVTPNRPEDSFFPRDVCISSCRLHVSCSSGSRGSKHILSDRIFEKKTYPEWFFNESFAQCQKIAPVNRSLTNKTVPTIWHFFVKQMFDCSLVCKLWNTFTQARSCAIDMADICPAVPAIVDYSVHRSLFSKSDHEQVLLC